MLGLQISSPPIRGRAVVTVKLDTSHLTVKQMHEIRLIIKTNGGEFVIPISCYVDYPTEESIRQVIISTLYGGEGCVKDSGDIA